MEYSGLWTEIDLLIEDNVTSKLSLFDKDKKSLIFVLRDAFLSGDKVKFIKRYSENTNLISDVLNYTAVEFWKKIEEHILEVIRKDYKQSFE